LLGPLEVRAGDAPVPLGTPQQRALLAVLALSPNQVVSRDRIIDELWGESPPASAAKLVQVYVSRLRKALGSSEVLVTRSPGYVLRVDADQIDIGQFEALLGRGRDAMAAGSPGEAADLLRQGLALWRGAPLADFASEPFAQGEARRLEEQRLAATEDRIEAELALGGTDPVGELETLIARNPFRERLRGQLMLALYRSGRQSEALAAYRDARTELVEEIGVEPGPALRGLEQAILAQDPSLDPPTTEPGVAAMPEPAPGEAREEAPVVADRFVGRERELALLLEEAEQAIAGRGGICLVAGDPGIGKSRLLDEVALRTSEHMRVLRGRCWEAGGAPAYWPWVDALRDYVGATDPESLAEELGPAREELATILPELGVEPQPEGASPKVAPGAARFRLFDALASFMTKAAAQEPILLELDDLHAADEPSLLLLQFLAGRVSSAPLLVVVAYRETELRPETPLASTVAELGRERATRSIALRGLELEDVGALIESWAGATAPDGAVSAIHRGTEGNPLFVAEVARLLDAEGRLQEAEEPLPLGPGVLEVIGRRLRTLSDPCREVLALASVLGREFEFSTLVHISERNEDELLDALEEALSARVITEVPGAPDRLRFAHVLIRDALYAELGGPRRLRLHRDVAEALEKLYAANREPHLAELAHHFSAAGEAGEPAKAVKYAREAGARATRQLAYEEAVRLYAVALRALPDEDQLIASRCELLLDLGNAQARAGAEDDSKESFFQAAKLSREAGLPEEMARAAVGYGGRFLWSRAITDERLVPLLEDALEAIGDEDSRLRVQLLSRLATALRGDEVRDRTERVAEDAVATARRLGDPAVLAYALDGVEAAVLAPYTVEKVRSDAEEIVALATEIGDLERLFDGHEHLFWATWILGDLAGRRAALAEMIRVAEELKQPPQRWMAASAEAAAALAEGRFSTAQQLIERAVRLGEGTQAWMAQWACRYQLFALRRELGELEGATGELTGPAESFPSPLVRLGFHAYLYLHDGRADEAKQMLRDLCARDLASWHMDEEWLSTIFLLAEICVELEDHDQAEQLYGLLAPYDSLNAVATAEVGFDSVSRPLGALASMLGRFDDADEHFKSARRMNTRMETPSGVARGDHQHARMLLARDKPGDRDRALELVRGARDRYRELGMETFAANAATLDRELAAGSSFS
jgi:DNA-binding SARP family transcriptional activator/tetratricopeptide (TPR) repeat protein